MSDMDASPQLPKEGPPRRMAMFVCRACAGETAPGLGIFGSLPSAEEPVTKLSTFERFGKNFAFEFD
jgi:hypothetical protein